MSCPRCDADVVAFAVPAAIRDHAPAAETAICTLLSGRSLPPKPAPSERSRTPPISRRSIRVPRGRGCRARARLRSPRVARAQPGVDRGACRARGAVGGGRLRLLRAARRSRCRVRPRTTAVGAARHGVAVSTAVGSVGSLLVSAVVVDIDPVRVVPLVFRFVFAFVSVVRLGPGRTEPLLPAPPLVDRKSGRTRVASLRVGVLGRVVVARRARTRTRRSRKAGRKSR